jgi:hypothetical protein
MKILIITVCVNYIDYLSFCFEKNKELFKNHYYYIITDSKDVATKNFCQDNNIKYFITDEFYHENKPFNKARAINTLFRKDIIQTDKQDFEYILLLDADCIIDNVKDSRGNSPLESFINMNDKDKNINCLYGCGRRIYNNMSDYNNSIYAQGSCNFIGFFQLFHKSNLFYNSQYLFEFKNASYYDCEFSNRFACRKCISPDVDHIGPIYNNWDGRHPNSFVWE